MGCPVGTVRSRLARGRALLRRRLEDSPPSGSSLVAPALLHLTARTAVRFAAGFPLAGVPPARVATVAMGVVESMSRTKSIAAASLIITITGMASLAAWAGQSGRAERASPPVSENRIDAAISRVRPPVAAAQADGGPRRKSSTQDGRTDQKSIGELPADFPAFVVETRPRLGDVEVDATATREIRIVFSKPMTDRSWSLTQGNVYAFPESAGPMHYLPDRRTCVVPVKLEPGKTYAMGINGGRFNNFKDAGGTPSLPSSLAFRTRKAK